MQIDIDFEVFKALTALRSSESDSYNAVIRRLLSLPNVAAQSDSPAINALREQTTEIDEPRGVAGSVKASGSDRMQSALNALLGHYSGGIWLGNVHFPDGTKFRATYKGKIYFAEVRNGKWLDQKGVQRSSPSEAASAITGNNVNGWRFWLVQLPNDPAWRKLDEFKS